MNVFEVMKSAIIELVVPAGSSKLSYTFDPQPFFNGKKIVSIEIYSANDYTLSPLNNAVAPSTAISTGYLTLYGADPSSPNNANAVNTNPAPPYGEYVQQVPLWDFHRLNNGTDPFVYDIYQMVPRNITWNKSYITLGAAFTPDDATSFMFSVGYIGVDNQQAS